GPMDSDQDHLAVGFPHSEIHGSKPARGSPWPIATCYVLHRLSMPRHPPNALNALDPNLQSHKLRPKASAHSALQLVIYDHELIGCPLLKTGLATNQQQ